MERAREEGLALRPTGDRCGQERVRQAEKVPATPLPQEMPMTSTFPVPFPSKPTSGGGRTPSPGPVVRCTSTNDAPWKASQRKQ